MKHLVHLTVLATACLVTQEAFAQVLVDQPPRQTFGLNATLGVESYADNFELSATEPVNIFKIYGTWEPSGMPNADTFFLAIHDNVVSASGEPGAILHSYAALTPTVVPTGNTFLTGSGSLAEYELTFNLPASVTLSAGVHWLEAYSNADSGSGDNFRWALGDQDPVFGLPCLAWASSNPGTAWNVCTVFFGGDNLSLVVAFENFDIVICDPAETNSTGNSAQLSTAPSTVGSGLHLEITGGVPDEFGYFLIGTGFNHPGIMIGNGRLCLSTSAGNSIGRYNLPTGPMNALGQFDSSGTFQNLVGTSTIGSGFDVPSEIPSIGGMITGGETWYFQAWYRDFPSSNFSNVLQVTF